MRSIKCWKREHARYALRHELGDAIFAIMIEDPAWTIYEPNHVPYEPMYEGILGCFFASTVMHFKRLKCLYGSHRLSFRSHWQQRFEQLAEYESTENLKRSMASAMKIQRYVEASTVELGMYIKMGESCKWPLCSKHHLMEGFATKSVCKGCRLVKYCGRNHQKKHWNLIHSQQCTRRYL